MAPKTIMRGGGALDSTSRTARRPHCSGPSSAASAPSGAATASVPTVSVPVRPASSIARASAATVRSSSGGPPSVPSYGPSGRTSRAAPSGPAVPPTTRASAAASPRAAADRAAASVRAPAAPVPPARTGVMRMSMTPPQVRPTAKASSSLKPKRSRTLSPLSSDSRHSSYTAPSTHPPDTLPIAVPSASTARAAPGCRGALPSVATTVATAKSRPCSHHWCSSAAMSSMVIDSLSAPVPHVTPSHPSMGPSAK